MAQASLRPHRLHHLLERRILVRIRRQRALPDRIQQLPHALLRIQPRPQRHRVHEEPYQPLQLAPSAVGHRCTQHHVVLATQPAHQQRPARLQHHEQGRSMPPCQPLQPCRQSGRQARTHHLACITLYRRPRLVRRQLQQCRRACQVLLPESQLPIEPLATEPLSLPVRIISVLHRKRCQWIRLPLAERRIQPCHLIGQHTHRPAVRHDVVHAHPQQVLPLAQLHQQPPDQRPPLQLESPRRGLLQHLPHGLPLLRLRLHRQVVSLERKTLARHHPLHRLSVLCTTEHRAQRLVALHDPVQRPLKRRLIEIALQAQRSLDVIRRTQILELLQKPQPLL